MIQENGYSYILEKILYDVTDRQEGVLYACIEIMAPENSDEIIEHFSIGQSASFYDDLQVLNNVSSFQPVLSRVDPMNIRNLSIAGLAQKTLSLNPAGFSIGLIIVAALIVVSLWSFQQRNDMKPIKKIQELFNRPSRDGKNESDLQKVNSVSSQDEKREADLWLVIPCKRIQLALQNRLREGGKFLADEAITLIDDSVYFLVTETAKYDPQVPANNGWQEFPEGGDLFVQLCIPGGSDLIGDDLKRSVSRKIADKEAITIKKIALLNDFNGLQDFNRA